VPWKETCAMDERTRLIGDWLSGRYSKSELSRSYGVSRPTVDKWVGRYETDGVSGLRERSRRPLESPLRTPDAVIERLIDAKHRWPSWGPKKLVWWLGQQAPSEAWPAPSTAGEILKRAGLVRPKRRRAATPAHRGPFRDCAAPNQVWSADFKGQFRTADGQWCYPLTITDNDSRYLLGCWSQRRTDTRDTRRHMEWTFREYGLPDAIRTDNGVPFAANGFGGLSAISVWWIRLGIHPERIAPGRPDQNGRHERMHRTLKADALRPAARNARAQQQDFNAFRQAYNHQRPHESLQMVPPAQRYRPSERRFPERLPELHYDDRHQIRRVRSNGQIKWRGDLIFVGLPLIGQTIGITENAQGQHELYFGSYLIAVYDPRSRRFQHPPV
jgi:transposase InsO family protein